jgi:hypothetical protein
MSGFEKPREERNVLLRNSHPGYISWQEFEGNRKLPLENAHMKKNCARTSARGGRALLTGLMRCGRCGRMMRVFYGMGNGNAHRYQCSGDDAHVGAGLIGTYYQLTFRSLPDRLRLQLFGARFALDQGVITARPRE